MNAASLEEKMLAAKLPPELLEKAREMISRSSQNESDSVGRYLQLITSLPWEKRSEDILDIAHAQEVLNQNHYGLKEAKEKILEYLAILKLSKANNRAPILLLVGLVGTGKTTLAYSIAQAMGRKFERIPFGGIGDALYLRGQSRAYPDAEPGAVIKALERADSKNPVILLDEIDRVSEDSRATIMGVLVELLDPEQNSHYTDHYLDFPFDLSEVLFIGTANNTANISTAVLDRLEPIQMPSYTDEEKITIGRDYVLPKILTDSGLSKNLLEIDPNIWSKIVRPLGYDSGIRTLERTISNMVRKAALLLVEGKEQKVVINETNLPQFLP